MKLEGVVHCGCDPDRKVYCKERQRLSGLCLSAQSSMGRYATSETVAEWREQIKHHERMARFAISPPERYTRFRDVPRLARAQYGVNIVWSGLERHIENEVKECKLDLDPDYQRAHVWTPAQQTAYVEYVLRGGESGRVLWFNHTRWQSLNGGEYTIADGKQRLEAARAFLRNDIKAFGSYYREFEDRLRLSDADFVWKVMALPTRADVLRWYLANNAGGTPHAPEELARVHELLLAEEAKESKP